jgi:hypothetical protein
MSEVMGMSTYDVYNESQAIRGVPALALRVGVALEKWARSTAERPVRTPHVVWADARAEHDQRASIRLF